MTNAKNLTLTTEKMKKYSILLTMAVLGFVSCEKETDQNDTQNYNYDFSVSTGTYQDLTNSTSLNNGNVWDDPQYIIPIGFDFEIGNKTYTTLYITEAGLGGVLISDPSSQGVFSLMAPIAQDIEDRELILGQSSSPISYKTVGTVGNRILKVEWNNVGFFGGGIDDYMNFQLWVYESSNIVEYRYGSSDVPSPSSFEGQTGPVVAFYPLVNWDTEIFLETGYYLKGNPESPTAVEINAQTDVPANALSGMIPDGTIYRFTPK